MPDRPGLGKDLARAWFAANVLSGLPSTLQALLTGGDYLEATRAAGAMLIAPGSPFPRLSQQRSSTAQCRFSGYLSSLLALEEAIRAF
jgi:hypothetical protein